MTACAAGEELAMPRDDDAHNEMVEAIEAELGTDHAWMGISDDDKDNVYTYLDGNSWNFRISHIKAQIYSKAYRESNAKLSL